MRISDWSSDVCSSDLFTHDPYLLHKRGDRSSTAKRVWKKNPRGPLVVPWTGLTDCLFEKIHHCLPSGRGTLGILGLDQRRETVDRAFGGREEGRPNVRHARGDRLCGRDFLGIVGRGDEDRLRQILRDRKSVV